MANPDKKEAKKSFIFPKKSMEKNEAPIQFPAMFTKKEYGFSLVIFSSSFSRFSIS